jgi:DNA mismatch repair ATPase MutL
MLNKNSINFNTSITKNINLRYSIKNLNKSEEKLKINKLNLRNFSMFLSKDLLKSMKVIGQFDKKFLVMINTFTNTLVIFDQHAIHERILYEFYSDLLYKNLFPYESPVKEPKKVNLSKYNLLESIFSKQILKYPLEVDRFKIIKTDISLFNINKVNNLFHFEFRFSNNKLIFYSVPIVLDRILDREEYLDIFKKILLNLENIVYFEGGEYKINANNLKLILIFFRDTIKSRACRDSVKFNEELDNVFIESLLNNLAECKNPFLCAHGRHNFYIIKDKNFNY